MYINHLIKKRYLQKIIRSFQKSKNIKQIYLFLSIITYIFKQTVPKNIRYNKIIIKKNHFKQIIQQKMKLFQLIKDSFQEIFLPNFDIKEDPIDTQYWRIIRENKLRTLKDLLSSNQLHPDDICISQAGHTFLHETVVSNRKEMFKLCLIFHADVNRRDKNQWTPLMKACALGRYQMVQDLIEKGADPYLADYKGENSFDKAEKFDQINVLNLLRSHFKNENSIKIEQNNQENTIIIDEDEKF
ncbi:ankyrin domain protein (macronuclear) [Tetrahymena thermophila SB210]|uniref:Ankyrin domain protein n=1 Tax=Tetrahymena thermophila (strain SB210) TaxID=312017 RepID=Q24C37_TETTS|nr:ankyrin domain protein [Tetrahymena thermophila SB210]EAS05401.2 ankyrin domain protein [Tetrahymena thermophila SB210]|eukprot:XP_001025646.2 ankyrin domain protein [Tetrahymena thermophila SB210]